MCTSTHVRDNKRPASWMLPAVASKINGTGLVFLSPIPLKRSLLGSSLLEKKQGNGVAFQVWIGPHSRSLLISECVYQARQQFPLAFGPETVLVACASRFSGICWVKADHAQLSLSDKGVGSMVTVLACPNSLRIYDSALSNSKNCFAAAQLWPWSLDPKPRVDDFPFPR